MTTEARVAEALWASFDDFVESRGRSLWRAAWLLTGDAAQAEDLVQTALTKSYRHFDRVNACGSFEAYVRRTLYTTFASWWGRRWAGTAPLPDAAASDSGPDAASTLDLARAVRTLPRAQRAVVVLRYFEDRTEAQTAEALGVSVGTVKSHHSRALKALRLSPHLAEPEEDA